MTTTITAVAVLYYHSYFCPAGAAMELWSAQGPLQDWPSCRGLRISQLVSQFMRRSYSNVSYSGCLCARASCRSFISALQRPSALVPSVCESRLGTGIFFPTTLGFKACTEELYKCLWSRHIFCECCASGPANGNLACRWIPGRLSRRRLRRRTGGFPKLRVLAPIVENQMEKKMENEMETGL